MQSYYGINMAPDSKLDLKLNTFEMGLHLIFGLMLHPNSGLYIIIHVKKLNQLQTVLEIIVNLVDNAVSCLQYIL